MYFDLSSERATVLHSEHIFDNRRPENSLFNVEGTYHAIGDTCTHRGGPLSEGDVQGTRVTCPWHGADFDLKTGAVLGPPAQKGVPSYNPRALAGQPETGAGQERRAEPVNLLFQNSIALAADRQREVVPPQY